MARKRAQQKVDIIRSKMPVEAQDEFDQFCRFNRNITDIHRWLVTRGHEVSWWAVRNWWHRNQQRGEQAQMLNQLSAKYEGLETDRVLDTVTGLASSLLIKGFNQTQGYLNELPPEDAIKVLQLTAGWMREARSGASQKQELKFMSERHEMAMAILTRFIEILDKTFEDEDEQFKSALNHGLRGAMMQVEQEIGSQN